MRANVVLGTILLLATAVAARAQVSARSLTWENIFSHDLEVESADISPDDRDVVATVSGGAGAAIYLVSLSDGNRTSRWADGGDPSWLGKSDRIVFSRDNDLWTVARDSQTPERITHDGIAKRAARPSPAANRAWRARRGRRADRRSSPQRRSGACGREKR